MKLLHTFAHSLTLDFFRNYLFSSRAGALIKRISWLSVIGLFVSVAALVIVISVMNALNLSIRERTLAIEPHLSVEFPSGTPFSVLESHPLTAKLKQQLQYEVQPFETQDVILRTMDGHFHGAVARGVSDSSYRRLLSEVSRVSKLRKLDLISFEHKEFEGPLMGEVDIGIELARTLGVFEGDALMVVPPEGLLLPPSEAPPFERVKIRRILATNLADLDSSSVFYKKDLTLNSLRKSASRRTGIEVWMANPDKAAELKEMLQGYGEYRIETWQERNSALFFALRMEKTVITIFLSMASLVAGFSLLTVLTLLTSQKRREIGLLRALGFSKKSLKSLFSKLGYGLALLGVGGGMLLGLAVSFYLEKYPLNVLPDIYYDSEIPAKVDLGFVAVVLLVAVILTWLGARASSASALLESPSTSLRNTV
jgi:lipoprotein-releasing system permease protein